MDLARRASAGSASPAMLTRSVADALRRVDRDVTFTFRPYERALRANTVQERMLAMLSGFFGGLALFLAALGLYGVMTYAVGRRRTEIGIRMALGAAPAAAVRLVLQRAGALVAVGVVLGAAMSIVGGALCDAARVRRSTARPRDARGCGRRPRSHRCDGRMASCPPRRAHRSRARFARRISTRQVRRSCRRPGLFLDADVLHRFEPGEIRGQKPRP